MNKLPDRAIAPGFFADPEFVPALEQLGLRTLDDVFAFNPHTDAFGQHRARHRWRACFPLAPGGPTVYLKRYTRTPVGRQIIDWFEHRRRGCTAFYDGHRTEALDRAGIPVPRTVAWGCQWSGPFEKRSFIMIHEIPDAQSLEDRLPPCMADFSPAAAPQRKEFVRRLADFVRRFHAAGFCHRDLYLCHIFLDTAGVFHLIDLQRIFKPLLLGFRYRAKDLAQLYYSAPSRAASRTDRLRFYLRYRQKNKLTFLDRLFIKQIKRRVRKIAARDRRKGKPVPFES